MPVPHAGDVSLSAEDKPPNYLIYRPPAVQLPSVPSMGHGTTPNHADNGDDGDENDDELLQEHHHIEDEHHNWLGGTTALKFLAAGGVAGAGQRSLCTYPLQHVSLSVHWTVNSVADIHSSVGPSESLPYNQATRPRRHFAAPRINRSWRESDYVGSCANICRGWCRCFLGWQRIVRRKDFSRVRNQVLDV